MATNEFEIFQPKKKQTKKTKHERGKRGKHFIWRYNENSAFILTGVLLDNSNRSTRHLLPSLSAISRLHIYIFNKSFLNRYYTLWTTRTRFYDWRNLEKRPSPYVSPIKNVKFDSIFGETSKWSAPRFLQLRVWLIVLSGNPTFWTP